MPFQSIRTVIEDMALAYTKLYMEYRSAEGVDPEVIAKFSQFFDFSDETWAMMDRIRETDSWETLPYHEEDGCPLCVEVRSVPR
jgi:hypothetical protein